MLALQLRSGAQGVTEQGCRPSARPAARHPPLRPQAARSASSGSPEEDCREETGFEEF